MVYDHIEFHNVDTLIEDHEVEGGLRLQRVPEKLRQTLSESGQKMMMSPVANTEIRFVLESDSVDITLSKKGEGPIRMFVFWGDFQERDFYEITQQPQTIRLTIGDRLKQLDPKYHSQSAYKPRMVRLMFTGYATERLYYHGIENGVYREPKEGEKPSKTLLCYGTSITHGAKLSGPHLTYPYLTARRLGMDLINLGSAGSAFCEKEMADYIAKRQDWSVATLALSVNMYNNGFTFETFIERVTYMVETIVSAHPNKPVFCINLFTFFDDVEVYNDDSTRNAEAYRQVLRDVVAGCDSDNVHIVEGTDLLEDFTLLAPDLIHPNDFGMLQIGERLSKEIESKRF